MITCNINLNREIVATKEYEKRVGNLSYCEGLELYEHIENYFINKPSSPSKWYKKNVKRLIEQYKKL